MAAVAAECVDGRICPHHWLFVAAAAAAGFTVVEFVFCLVLGGCY